MASSGSTYTYLAIYLPHLIVRQQFNSIRLEAVCAHSPSESSSVTCFRQIPLPLVSSLAPVLRAGYPAFMSVRIVVPRPSDAEAIAEVHIRAWKDTYDHLLPAGFFTTEWQEGRRQLWRVILGTENPHRSVRVAVSETPGEERRIVGFALAGRPQDAKAPRGLLLYSLYVLAEHHGAGVGQGLLEAVLGDRPAFLWVERTNARARAFYERNGFDVDGVEQVEEQFPGIVEVRMVR